MSHKKGKFKQGGISVKPWNQKQQKYFDAICRSRCIFGVGPAGTGKTFLATMMGVKGLLKGDFKRLICCTPAVDAGNPMGFDPGTELEKLTPWLRNVIGVLETALDGNKGQVQGKIASEEIMLVSLQKMRGANYDDAFIIMDEAQNATPREMKMFLTRKTDNSVVVVNGDISQADIPGTNGMQVALDVNDRGNLAWPVIRFGYDDIVRGMDCKGWVVNWDCWEQEQYERADGHTSNAAQIPMVL